MEQFLEQLRQAHNEVIEATGWDDALSQLRHLLANAPEAASALWQDAGDFMFAVNWREPLLVSLGGFLAALLALVLYLALWRWCPPRPRPAGVSRVSELAATRAEEKLFGLGAVLLLLAFCAFPLNKLGIAHGHRVFRAPGVNYFDESALFIGVVYWLPLITLSLLVQGKLVFNVLRLMVLAKREQLKASHRAAKAASDRNAKKRD